jgi:hypothetical protein
MSTNIALLILGMECLKLTLILPFLLVMVDCAGYRGMKQNAKIIANGKGDGTGPGSQAKQTPIHTQCVTALKKIIENPNNLFQNKANTAVDDVADTINSSLNGRQAQGTYYTFGQDSSQNVNQLGLKLVYNKSPIESLVANMVSVPVSNPSSDSSQSSDKLVLRATYTKQDSSNPSLVFYQSFQVDESCNLTVDQTQRVDIKKTDDTHYQVSVTSHDSSGDQTIPAKQVTIPADAVVTLDRLETMDAYSLQNIVSSVGAKKQVFILGVPSGGNPSDITLVPVTATSQADQSHVNYVTKVNETVSAVQVSFPDSSNSTKTFSILYSKINYFTDVTSSSGNEMSVTSQSDWESKSLMSVKQPSANKQKIVNHFNQKPKNTGNPPPGTVQSAAQKSGGT